MGDTIKAPLKILCPEEKLLWFWVSGIYFSSCKFYFREIADDQTILAAHRKIMFLNHPDNGGSTYLATKINEAKEKMISGVWYNSIIFIWEDLRETLDIKY